MKRISTMTALLLSVVGCSGPESPEMSAAMPDANPLAAYAPTAAQQAEVVGTLQRLFDALESGDEALLRSVTDASLAMHFSETRDGATTFGSATLDGLATRITSSEMPLIERMWDPTVIVNGPLATIWTPYDFYAGETFSHCGVDSANMLHTEEGWKIVALSWTRLQPPTCDLHPDGPPAA
jgi:hypothetical protein